VDAPGNHGSKLCNKRGWVFLACFYRQRHIFFRHDHARGTSRSLLFVGFISTVIFVQIYTRKPPFEHHKSCARVVLDVVAGIRPNRPPHSPASQLTDDVWELMQRCWEHDPSRRLPINVVLLSVSLMNHLRRMDLQARL
jgi:hypothetical protein